MDTILNWLFDPSPLSPRWPYILLIVFFAVLAAAGGVAYFLRARLFPNQPLRVELAARFGPIGLGIGAVGLVLLLLRFFTVPYVSMRSLLLLVTLIALAFIGYLAYVVVARYPALAEAQRAEQSRARPAAHAHTPPRVVARTPAKRKPKKRHR